MPEADAFQIRATQPLREGLARAPAASMQYRLNNYDLPNPPRALRDQARTRLGSTASTIRDCKATVQSLRVISMYVLVYCQPSGGFPRG